MHRTKFLYRGDLRGGAPYRSSFASRNNAKGRLALRGGESDRARHRDSRCRVGDFLCRLSCQTGGKTTVRWPAPHEPGSHLFAEAPSFFQGNQGSAGSIFHGDLEQSGEGRIPTHWRHGADSDDVCRFQVAVNDPAQVGIGHRLADLFEDRNFGRSSLGSVRLASIDANVSPFTNFMLKNGR